jgi:adenosylhomocysteine nucleosidase
MKILIVSAIEEEVESLSDNFEVTLTGVGKINAAITLQTALLSLQLQNKLPQVVVNYGTGGKASDKVEVGKMYEIGKFLQRDMNVCQLNIKKYQTPFEENTFVENNRSGLICGTGDNFWTPDGTDDFDVVDMEAYALAVVCQRMNIPFRCFKYISDSGDIDEWRKNVSEGAKTFESIMKELYTEEATYECIGRR